MAHFVFLVIYFMISGAVIGADQENESEKLAEIYNNLKDSAPQPSLTRRTCSVWQAEGLESDHLLVNPNGDGAPLVVYCNMSTTPATMVLEHDHMDTKTIRGPRCDSVACVRSGTIVYFSASLDRLIELIGASRSCQQYVRYECYNSGMDFTRWMTHDDRVMSHWGSSFRESMSAEDQTVELMNYNNTSNYTTNSTTCGCFLRGDCVNGQLCNCNNGNNYDNRWYVDEGYLFSETSPAAAIDLPVKEVGFGRFPWSNSEGNYTIGPLTCMDKVRGCPKAPTFDNTVNDADKLGHMAGDVVNYTCAEGFINPVSPSLRCGYDGAWERKTITCERVNCGDPGNSATTNRTLDGTRYGDTVTYTCKQGYKYERGDVQRNCTASGTWTGEIMTCSPGMIAFSATSSRSYFGYQSGPIPFDLASVNVGGAYSNTSRGVFTTPFEGLYHFDVHLATYSSNTFYAYIYVNGRSVRTIYISPYSGGRYRGSSSVLLQLSEGHTVHVELSYSSYYSITLGQESTFSGFLLQHGQQT